MSKNKSKDIKSNISYYYLKSLRNLYSKYNSFEYSYQLVCINNIIYTEKCHIVARFKDFLYYDDSTEFFNKFFNKIELNSTLSKVFNFYAKYCKVFPNYMILPENEFLYRNLRKKQKMIDQFNEIKREEEENRKHIKLKKNKQNENDYIIFNKKVQDSIEKYKPSFTQSSIIMADYLNFSNINHKKESTIFNENSITISLNYNNTNVNNFDLNDVNTSELSLISIANNIVSNKNKKDKNNNKLSFTPPKKKLKTEKIATFDSKNNNGFNKKFISHYQNAKNTNIKSNKNHQKININNNNPFKNKEIINNINNLNNSIKKDSNISLSHTSNNLLTNSIAKTNKEKNSKNLSKNIKSNITKKKLFSATEKTIQHKKPIYNYNNQLYKNSNFINSKINKNYNKIISITGKPSISPPNTKLNTLKLKLMTNLISKSKIKNKNNKLVYNNSNFNKSSNLSYIKNNKNRKYFSNNENINDYIDKINLSKNKINKKVNGNKKTAKEIMKNYKNILKTKKTSHYSYDINKNNFFSNKNIFTNLTEKNIQNNISSRKGRKSDQLNKYISPANIKDIKSNGKNIKTPLKPEINNKFHNIIVKTKEASQTKMQNFIKKIFEQQNYAKKNYFTNQKKI